MINSEQQFFEALKAISKVAPTAPVDDSPVKKDIEEARGPEMTKVPVSLRNLFTHSETHPVVIDLALLKAFGVEWFRWEIETLHTEIHRVFGTQISEHNRSKIQALRTCHLSLGVWEHWQVFEKVVQVFNNNLPNFELMQAPSVEDLYVAIDIINEVRKEEFSDEVKRYMAASCLHDDVHFVPPPLDIIQAELAHPYYECLDCGNHQEALYSDGLCDVCVRRFDPSQGFSFKPDPDMVAKGRGKNVTVKLKYDPSETEKVWNRVAHLPSTKIQLDETTEEIQVAKLIVARDFMNIRRAELSEQLVALKSWLGS